MGVEFKTDLKMLNPAGAERGPGNSRYTEADIKKLKKAAKDFESIIIGQMLKNMRRSMPEGGMFGEGVGSDMYQAMFDETMADAMASKGVFQLSDNILKSFGVDEEFIEGAGRTIDDYRLNAVKINSRSVDPYKWDRSIIAEAGEHFGVDPKLIDAVIKVESAYKSDAVSRVGATGLMQLMKETADELGVRDRKDVRDNVFGGTRYLKGLLGRFDGNLELALAAYNAGPSAVEKHNGIPPYRETQRYVEKVMNHYKDNM